MEVKARFWGPESVPFPLNRGVPSTEVIDKTIIQAFLQNQLCVPLMGVSFEQRCPKGKVPLQ